MVCATNSAARNGKINNIDPARISPLMKYIYSILPEPNKPGVNPLIANNYTAPNPNIQNQYTYSMRFDQRFTDQDLVYGRITKADANRLRPASGGVPTLNGFGNSRSDTSPNESLSLDWTRTQTPTLVNEFTFSASRTVSTQFSGNPTVNYAAKLGLPNPNAVPGYPVINWTPHRSAWPRNSTATDRLHKPCAARYGSLQRGGESGLSLWLQEPSPRSSGARSRRDK
jgi:hypothetical protein